MTRDAAAIVLAERQRLLGISTAHGQANARLLVVTQGARSERTLLGSYTTDQYVRATATAGFRVQTAHYPIAFSANISNLPR